MKTTIEKFKEIFPNCSYDNDNDWIEAYDNEGNHIATLFNANSLIDEFYEGNTIESGELDPQERYPIQVSSGDYIKSEFGDYLTAFNSI